MKTLAVLAGAGFVALAGISGAMAQSAPVSGTPGSPFPYAAPHEIRWINGVPCRTVFDHTTRDRVPVACAGQVSGVAAPMAPVDTDVVSTGSIAPAPVAPMMGAPVSGTPGSAFPYAAPHEIRYINGVPCRTVFDYSSQERVPVACAQ